MSGIESVTDARGRKIEFKPLGVLEQTRLLRIIGRANPLDAQNQPYVELVQFAAMVQTIDGAPVRGIADHRHIDGAIEQLGDDGYMALTIWFQGQVKSLEEAALEAASNPGPQKGPLDDAKN